MSEILKMDLPHFTGNGKHIYKNGDIYEGRWLDGMKHGKGKLYYDNDKKTYIGNFVDNKRDGYGELIKDNKNYFKGDWKNDKMNGYGEYTHIIDGGTYKGNFVDGYRSGYGNLIWEDGEWCEGEWKDDFQNGKGSYHWKNGDYYEGNFVNDMSEGYGVKISKDYEIRANWKNDKPIDGSILYYESNNKYDFEGYYHNNIFFGKLISDNLIMTGEFIEEPFVMSNGRKEWADGEYCEGYFDRKSNMNRNGIYHYVNGDEYKGEFKNHLFHGKGTLQFNNGVNYIGEWKEDLKEGFGVMTINNGNIYSGTFKENKLVSGNIIFKNHDEFYKYEGEILNWLPHGSGKMEFNDGKILECQWKNGKQKQDNEGIYLRLRSRKLN